MDGKGRLAGRIKDSWERKITSVLVSAALLFALLFVPAEWVAPLADRLGSWGHSNRFWRTGADPEAIEATGAYYKYREINGILRSWFEKDVLSAQRRPVSSAS